MKTKRILSLLLSMLLVLSLLPVPAVGAAEDPPEQTVTAPQAEAETVDNPNPIKTERVFTTQPAGGSIAPGGYYKFTWKTNFTPVSIQLRRMGSDEYVYTTFQTLAGTATSHSISYDTASGFGSGTRYRVYAFYGSGVSDYVYSATFQMSLTPRTVTKTSPDSTLRPGSSYHLTWTTNFTPVKIEICSQTGILYTPFQTLSGSKTSWDIPYDTAAAFGGNTYYKIRAYFGSGDYEFVQSIAFQLDLASRSVEKTSPGSTLRPGSSYHLTWASNFTPVKIEICSQTGILYTPFQTLSGSETSWDIPYDTAAAFGGNTYYKIRAYFGSGDYDFVQSIAFQLDLASRSVEKTSPDSTLSPGSSYHLTWASNFTPVKIEICSQTGTLYTPFQTLSGSKTSWDIPYDTAAAFGGNTYYKIRAYFGSGNYDFVQSIAFQLNLAPRTFTVQPQGGTVKSNRPLTVSWATNFTPVKVAIAKHEGYYPEIIDDNIPPSAASYPLTYDTAHGYGSGKYCIVAFYGSNAFDIVCSQDFMVNLEYTIFTTEPETSITLNEGGSAATLSWGTSVTPDSLSLMLLPDGQSTPVQLKQLQNTATGCTVSFAELSSAYELLGVKSETGKLFLRAESASRTYESRMITFTLNYRSSGSFGNLSWSYGTGSQQLTVSGSGSMPNWSSVSNVPWAHWIPKIKTVTVSSGVSSVGSNAFNGAVSLTRVNLYPTVTAIGEKAFRDCTALADVYFLGAKKAFDAIPRTAGNDPLWNAALHASYIDSGSCGTGLSWKLSNDKTLTISGSGAMADYNDSSSRAPWYADYRGVLEKLVIGNGVTSIGDYAFYGCVALKRVDASAASLVTVGNYAFGSCSALSTVMGLDQSSLNSLGTGVFYYCRALKSVPALSANVTQIPPAAFQGCSQLSTAAIPAQVVTIGQNAFRDCSVLVSVSFASGTQINAIGSAAFRGCTALTTIHLPDQIATLGSDVFNGCSHLVTANLPSALSSMGTYVFYGCTELSGSFAIPAGITKVPSYTFYHCGKITGVSFHSGITEIGANAFNGCTGLTWKLNLPSGVTKLGEGAFRETSFSQVILPGSVSTIGANAFNGCSKLILVYYDGLRPQWDLMSIGSGNEALTQASRYYQGYSGTEASFSWSCSGDGVLSVYSSSASAMDDLTLNTQPWKDFRQYIVRVDVRNELTGIGQHAFRGLTALKEVHLDATVSAIGSYAFYGCSALTDVYYNSLESDWSGVTVGSNNAPLQNAAMHFLTSIEGEFNSGLGWRLSTDGTLSFFSMNWGSDDDLDIPDFDGPEDAPWYPYRNQITAVVMEEDAVTRIGENAFACLSNLQSVRFSRVVTELGENAFNGCPDEMEIFFPGISYDWWNLIYDESDNVIPGNDCLEEAYVSFDKVMGEIGNTRLCWELDSSGLLYIYSPSGYGAPDPTQYAIPDYPDEQEAPEWGKYASVIRKVVLEEGVNRIGAYAFDNFHYDSYHLQEIEIPNTVSSIGNGALARTELQRVVFPDSVTELGSSVLFDCTKLSSLTFPGGISAIPDSMCYNLDALTSVVIPEGVSSIGSGAFSNCDSLTELFLPSTLTTVEASAFRFTNLSDVYINDYWFNVDISYGAYNATMENAVWHYNPFGGVLETGLLWELRPDGCLAISGDGPMPNWTAGSSQPWASKRALINSLEIGEGVTKIGDFAFWCCTRLASASLPDTLTHLGKRAFYQCYDLAELELPNSLRYIDFFCFGYCTSLTELVLPDSVTGISTRLFQGCTGLTSVTLPYPLKTVTSWTFLNCTSLQSVRLEENVTLIGTAAFGGCSSLQDIYYGGIQAWWNEVGITATASEGTDNSALTGLLAQHPEALHCLGVPLREKRFPDEGFRDYLAGETKSDSVDADGNGYLSESERSAVGSLDVHSMGIASVVGIEWFPNLYSLDCSDNLLSELSLSGIPELEFLSCQQNRLTELDLSGLSSLDTVNCSENLLESLSWDAAACASICSLDCSKNALTGLDLGESFDYLYCLDCSYNAIDLLQLDNLAELNSLSCQGNELTELDLSALDHITTLDLSYNRVEQLDVGHLLELEELCCFYNGMTELTLPAADPASSEPCALRDLQCHGNALTELDLSGTPKLLEAVKQGVVEHVGSTVVYRLSAENALLCMDEGLGLTGLAAVVELWFVYKPNDGVDNCPVYVVGVKDGVQSEPILLAGEDCYTDAFDYCAAYRFRADPYFWDAVLFSDGAGQQTAALNFTQGTVESGGSVYRVWYADSFSQLEDGPDVWLISTEISVEPSCTEDGYNSFYGLITLQSITETEPALGHSYQPGTVHDPSCTEGGWRDYVCSVCGALEPRDFTDPTGHSFGDWSETAAPSCEDSGEQERVCSVCNASEFAVLEPLGHDWGEAEYSFSEAEPGEAMRCTASVACARCGESVTETAAGQYAVITAPTTGQTGFGAWSFAFEDSRFVNQIRTVELPVLSADYVTVYVVDRSDALNLGYSVWGDEGRQDQPPIPPSGIDKDGCCYYEFQVNVTGYGQGLSLNDDDALLCPLPEGEGLDPATDAAGRGWVIYVLDRNYAASQAEELWPGPGEILTAPSCTEDGLARYVGLKTGSILELPIPANGHSYVNGECVVCHALLKASELYDDVSDDAWYAQAVLWATLNGVTSGTSAGSFSPDQSCTRAQVVTMLWRAYGSPQPESTEHSFTDVEAGSYYETAVCWAVEHGITAGTSADSFSPNWVCTRAQVVTFLWRAAGSPEPESSEISFPDVVPGSYYEQAVRWAVSNGITAGTGPNAFSPNRVCTRAQAVTFLYRNLAT